MKQETACARQLLALFPEGAYFLQEANRMFVLEELAVARKHGWVFPRTLLLHVDVVWKLAHNCHRVRSGWGLS